MSLKTLLAVLIILFGTVALGNAAPEGPEQSLRGKLVIQNQKPALLEPEGKTVKLASDDESISETLADDRLAGRELKVVGESRSNGSFLVREFFVVRGETLYKIIYFCDVCHITTFRPGACLCCQQPTVLTEVPPTDPRVYHEDIKGYSSPPSHQDTRRQ